MFGLSFSHLIVLFIVILLFGSRRLPELGQSLGSSIRAFKKGLEGEDPNGQTQLSAKTDDSSKPNQPS